MKKICEICGREFEARSNSAKYCSIECNAKSPDIQRHVGEEYGKLKIIKMSWDGRKMIATCQCQCGNVKDVRHDSLVSGRTVSCGCVKKEHYFKSLDLTGKKFEKLTAIKATDKKKDNSGSIIWECKCDCGKTTYVEARHLVSKKIESCGCKTSEVVKENVKKALLSTKDFIKDGTNYKMISSENPLPTNHSGYRNISWDDSKGKWVVQLDYKGKHYHIGRFEDIKIAVMARDEARKARENDRLAEWVEEYRKEKSMF